MKKSSKSLNIEISYKSILFFFGCIGAIWLAIKLYSVFLMLFLAFSIAAMVSPMIDFLEKKKFSKNLSILVVYTAFISTLALIILIVYKPLIHQIQVFLQALPDIVVNGINFIVERIPPLQENFDWDEISKNIRDSFFENIPVSDISGQIFSSLKSIFGVIGSIFGALFNIIATLILSAYFVKFKEGSKEKVVKLLPEKHQKSLTRFFNRVEDQLGSWLRAQVLLMLIIGFLGWFGLRVINIQFALPLGVIAGVLEAVPNIGPIVTWIIAILVGLGSQIPTWKVIFIAVWFILIQQFENYLIVPKVMERAVGTNPIVTIIAILIGSHIFGIWGALLAVPTVTILQIVLQYYLKYRKNS